MTEVQVESGGAPVATPVISIGETMKAWVLREPYRFELVELPVPVPGPHEVLVKLKWVGICGSDVEAYKGHRKPEFLTDPIRLGHELFGYVAAVGDLVGGLRPGNRVTARDVWGAFAEYVCFDATRIQRIPDELPDIDASIVEVLPGVLKTIERAAITRETNVLIIGQGVSGLVLTQVARLCNPRRLVVADLFEEKLAMARAFGATHTVQVTGNQDLVDRCMEACPEGYDVVIPAHMDPHGMAQCFDLARINGRILVYGCIGPAEGIDFFKPHIKRADILFTRCDDTLEMREKFVEGIRYVVDGLINVAAIVTHTFHLLDLPEAFRLKEDFHPDVIHILIDCEMKG